MSTPNGETVPCITIPDAANTFATQCALTIMHALLHNNPKSAYRTLRVAQSTFNHSDRDLCSAIHHLSEHLAHDAIDALTDLYGSEKTDGTTPGAATQ